MITGLDHVQVAMPADQEEVARRFYGGLLGLPEIAKPTTLQGRGGVWFRVGAQQLHLGTETPFRPARKAHPAFLVDALDELASTLSAAGVVVTFDDALPRYRRFYADDPFGNRLELLTPHNTPIS